MKNRIVIITTGWFPEGDAGAIRLVMVGKALLLCNYQVTVLCRGECNKRDRIEGIEYISLRGKFNSIIGKLIDYSRFPSKVKTYLESNKNDLTGVYIYNAHESVFMYCKSFCNKNRISLIHDCVEWYSPEEYKLGKYDPWYRSKDRINQRIIDKNFKVIAIS